MTTRRSAKTMVVAGVLAGVLSVLAAPAAWATGPEAGGNGHAPRAHGMRGSRGDRHYQPAANQQAVNPHNFGPSYPFGYNYKGPSYPFGSNYYRAPVHPPTVHVKPGHRWVPGYWARQWVPQYYTYQVWVPGYWDVYGAWVPGYYGTQAGESGGYYQQVWVDGYWSD